MTPSKRSPESNPHSVAVMLLLIHSTQMVDVQKGSVFKVKINRQGFRLSRSERDRLFWDNFIQTILNHRRLFNDNKNSIASAQVSTATLELSCDTHFPL